MTLLHRGYKWGILYHKKTRQEGRLACHRLLLQQKVRHFNAGLGAIGPALEVSMHFRDIGRDGDRVGVNAG
jgi:hypothetical protein